MDNVKNFDVAIIGSGVAGTFAAYKLAQDKVNCVLFDIGRPPAKRRRQLEGFLGCLPNSDGKFYDSNLESLRSILDKKTINKYNKEFFSFVNNSLQEELPYIEDVLPGISFQKKIKKFNFDVKLNHHHQIIPKQIHCLSKSIASVFRENKNLFTSFDDEVSLIKKEKGGYYIESHYMKVFAKKVIYAVGRASWRVAGDFYKKYNLIEDNSNFQFGVNVEVGGSYLKDLNKSHCTLERDDLCIGPFSWDGTVIPEDHVDFATSVYRGNENRWKTEKCSFNLFGKIQSEHAYEELDRISKLTFIVGDERVFKEKLNTLFDGKSKLNVLPEYKFIAKKAEDLCEIIPELRDKAYLYAPCIKALPPKISLSKKLESNLPGFFVVGESAGVSGLLSAAVMGLSVAKSVQD